MYSIVTGMYTDEKYFTAKTNVDHGVLYSGDGGENLYTFGSFGRLPRYSYLKTLIAKHDKEKCISFFKELFPSSGESIRGNYEIAIKEIDRHIKKDSHDSAAIVIHNANKNKLMEEYEIMSLADFPYKGKVTRELEAIGIPREQLGGVSRTTRSKSKSVKASRRLKYSSRRGGKKNRRKTRRTK